MSFEIPFIEFHRPNGRQSVNPFPCDAETFALYEKVKRKGFRMTVEILSSGQISLCIEDPALGDFDCVVKPNGPEVPAGVHEMLQRFSDEKADAWRAQMTA